MTPIMRIIAMCGTMALSISESVLVIWGGGLMLLPYLKPEWIPKRRKTYNMNKRILRNIYETIRVLEVHQERNQLRNAREFYFMACDMPQYRVRLARRGLRHLTASGAQIPMFRRALARMSKFELGNEGYF